MHNRTTEFFFQFTNPVIIIQHSYKTELPQIHWQFHQSYSTYTIQIQSTFSHITVHISVIGHLHIKLNSIPSIHIWFTIHYYQLDTWYVRQSWNIHKSFYPQSFILQICFFFFQISPPSATITVIFQISIITILRLYTITIMPLTLVLLQFSCPHLYKYIQHIPIVI